MKIKQVLGLLIGLVVGVAGGFLFSNSMPPEEGSLEEKYEIAQSQLKKTERRLEALTAYQRRELDGTKGRMRDLARDVREGREISPDDLLGTMKPWMRDLSPIFQRMREVNAEDWADAQTSEWARKYDLTRAERETLKSWFEERARERAQALADVIESDQSGFVDFIKASEYGWRDSQGADEMMAGFLEGEELERFKADRLAERAESVQSEADLNLARLDSIVELDDQQHRELFSILARGSRDYEPAVLEGGQAALDLQSRNAAIDQVLRPDQLQLLNEHRDNRRAEAEQKMNRLGMTLPKNWDVLERDPF